MLESSYSTKTIGLVKGGWLPSGLALQEGMVVMPDRCTITELIGRFLDGKKTESANDDFLDFFADQHIRINPLLFALEGNLKKNPTPDVVEQQFEWACAKIKAALPKAELVPAGKESLRGVVGIINDTQASMTRKQDFLMRLAPTLQGSVSAHRLPGVWDDVLATADECGVARRSMVVLAALSAAAVPNGKSPAKKLLKLTKPNYSKELAYNALADLRSLEILMYLFALFPNERLVLCTGDKDLALFWAGIRVSGFAWQGGYFQCKFSPVEALLPNVTLERVASYFSAEDPPQKPMTEPKHVLTVQINNGYAYVLEDTTHVVELTVEDQDKKIVGDANVIGADEKWEVAWLSTEKMLRYFEMDVGGPMWVKLARLNSVYQAFSQGKTLDAPVMFSGDGTSYGISIMDGRHRTKALHNLGARKVPVMVPESQVELFKVELG